MQLKKEEEKNAVVQVSCVANQRISDAHSYGTEMFIKSHVGYCTSHLKESQLCLVHPEFS